MSLRSHIATLLARRAGKIPISRVEPTYPPVITTEDVTPPFEAECSPAKPAPIPEPDVCALPSCNNAVTWPQFWCCDGHMHSWNTSRLSKPGPNREAA